METTRDNDRPPENPVQLHTDEASALLGPIWKSALALLIAVVFFVALVYFIPGTPMGLLVFALIGLVVCLIVGIALTGGLSSTR